MKNIFVALALMLSGSLAWAGVGIAVAKKIDPKKGTVESQLELKTDDSIQAVDGVTVSSQSEGSNAVNATGDKPGLHSMTILRGGRTQLIRFVIVD